MIFRKPIEEPDSIEVLPRLLTQALGLLEDEAVVIDNDQIAIFQSDEIGSLNILRNNRLVSEELLAIVRAVRRTEREHRGSVEILRGPLGEGKRKLRVAVTALDEDHILILISDESEKSRVDAIRRDFIANISHELKTPIGALSLLSEAISQAQDEPEAMERFASRIKSEAKRLEGLVKEIISLSQLQGDDPLADAKIIEVDEITKEAINQAETSAEARNIEIERSGDKGTLVSGDRKQLIMAIHNLIENAINYSPERTRIVIAVKIIDKVVEISVMDQGIGIRDDETERIFERFYRVDPARSRETGGTGLGLSIVKHVAQNHGGEIKVWSKLGVGSTFALRLPATDSTLLEDQNVGRRS